MSRTTRFSPEVRERAALLVREHLGEYPSKWGGPPSRARPAA
jgi:hypothetical protein